MVEISQGAPAQKASWGATSAMPPADCGITSRVRLSVKRVTWYSGDAYSENRARTRECAATQGVPPLAKMSHTPAGAAAAALAGKNSESSTK